MSQEISGDPVTDLGAYSEGRYVFSAQEDNIASLMNDNWRKAVDLAEKFDGEISTLQTEMDDAEDRLDTAESDITSLETDVGEQLKGSHYNDLLLELAVCSLTSSGASGDKTLEVSPTTIQLYDGDKLVAFDPADGSTTPVTVDGDQPAGTTNLSVSSLGSGINNEVHLVLDHGTSARGTDAAIDKVDSYLSNLSQNTSLSGVASDVETLQSDMNTAQSDISDLQTDINNISAEANNLKTKNQNVTSRVTTLENEAKLGVTSREKGDEEIALVDWSQVSYNLDGSQTDAKSEIPVDGIQEVLKEGDYLVAYNDEDNKNYFVQLDANPNTSGDVVYDPDQHSGGAVLDLKSSYKFDLPDDSSVFLAPISLRSEVSVVEDEVALRVKKSEVVSELNVQLDKITTKTDVFRSDNFPSAAVADTDPTGLDKSGFGDGDVGWALFENGDFAAVSGYFQGFLEAGQGRFQSGILMEQDAGISDKNNNFLLSSKGFDLYGATDGQGLSQYYGLWNGKDGSFLGGMTANIKEVNETTRRKQLILDSLTGEMITRAKTRAEVKSVKGDTVLTAQEGSIRLRSQDLIAQNVRKAAGETELVNDYPDDEPPINMVWMDTDTNTLKLYEPSSIDLTVDASFEINTAVGDSYTVKVTDSSNVTGGSVESYQYEWGDGSSSTPGDGSETYTYNNSGDKTIKLTVTVSGDGTTKTDTEEKTISIPTLDESDVSDPVDWPPSTA